MSADPFWRQAGGCATEDPETFFPDSYRGRFIAQAKAICAGCPVLAACQAWITANPSQYGIYAGMTPDERRPARVRQEVPA